MEKETIGIYESDVMSILEFSKGKDIKPKNIIENWNL